MGTREREEQAEQERLEQQRQEEERKAAMQNLMGDGENESTTRPVIINK